ncbi:MAG TPA: SRPBCC family protein [Acidimicrobiales bacterium]|nr:SRPBCC family protein [Acidimicrobiales bacterium]
MTDRDSVSVERVVHAPAAAIFEVLATPSRHHTFDGSGTVRNARGVDGQVGLGDRFGMSMKMGVPYSMESEIVEFEPERLIAWRTTGPGKLGRHAGGRVWRYELEVDDGGTLVRETWDISGESAISRPFVRRLASKTLKDMSATLDRLEELLGTSSGA